MLIELLAGIPVLIARCAASIADSMTDATWAEVAGIHGVGHRQGIKIEAAVVGREVLVTASTRHLGRIRENWAQVRVPAWDGQSDWDTYHMEMGRVIRDKMAAKLAARERR